MSEINNVFDLVKHFEKLCDILQGDKVAEAKEMLKRPGSFAGIASSGNVRFPFTLHVLVITLIEEDSKSIFDEMTDKQLVALKALVDHAKGTPKLNEDMSVLLYGGSSFKELYKASSFKSYNVLKQDLFVHIITHWSDIVSTLNEWSDVIGQIQVERENKKLEKAKVKRAFVDFNPDVHWTLQQLSEKLGYKNKGVLYNTSEKIRAQNPEFDAKQSEFFVDSTNPGTGKRIKAFVIEKFDEFKAFFQGGKASENAISIAEFAKILGVSKSCLQIRFFQFFHDEKVDEATKKEVDSWFEHKGQKPDHKTALKKQFLNDAIALFGKTKQQCVVSKEQQACTKNVEQGSKKQSKKTKSAKPATKAKKSSNDVKSVQDIVSVQPKNMLDVIALDKTLKQLTEFYADACNEQDLAEACYNEKLAALQVAPVEQRKELLADAQRATEEAETARTKAEKLRKDINELNDLSHKYDNAKNALNAAETEIMQVLERVKLMQY